ncbi:Enzymatic polyprotein [Vitis vinifera]|uniref:Enzymatic polyprotein n=1 Tax=Vitis vinifera TaxID=29760 RepID=A0A438C670_VITVI|nr:Enzymatic polyprotein [Vitis vinifera]
MSHPSKLLDIELDLDMNKAKDTVMVMVNIILGTMFRTDDQVIRLLDNRSVEKHKKDGYNFIHFGMIQVAAKPLTRLGLNTAIVMCLRDNRHLEYRDSIIGAVQAGLNDGPVYFQCYPNFTVRLRDADILDSVVLHIKTHGFKIKPGNSPVSIITRFAYKSMNTSVGSGALCTSPKGETTYFHSDMLDKSDFIIPKKILWKDVDFPVNWHFTNVVPAIAQRSESIEQIVQYPDGGGELVFSKSFRHSSSPRVSVYEPSRASSSSIPVRTTREEEGSSSGNPKNVKLTGVRSYTNMINTISLSDEDFEINKDLLRKDFYSEVNKQRNDWFFSTIPKEYPEYPCKYINNTSTKAKIWKTSDNIVIESIHPPEAKIEKNINGTIVTASPFKTKPEDKGTASASDIRRIMEQINYTNMFLITLGNQVNRVEEIIEAQDHLKKPFVKNDNKPLFKPFELSKKFQENPQIDQAFIDKISQKVKDNLVIPETPQPSHRRILLDYDDKQEKRIILNALTIKDLQEEIGQYKKDIENLRQPTSSEIPIPQDYINRNRQALFGANGKKLIIKYKLSNAHICNQGICIKQTFILVKDLKEKVLLGVPFLSSIFPMWVDDQGIKTKLLDKEILFEFANPPGERSINTIKDQVIKAKQNHINLLKQEIALVRIEDQLKVKKTQDAIESLKNKIIKEVCSNIPNAFWHRKQHEDFGKSRLQKKIDSVEQHWKHLNRFIETVKSNGLILSATKINLFQTKVRFLGHHIHQGTFTPIQRSIEFADKFPDEIKDKKQLQRFLGSLNYVSDFIQDLSQLCAPLRQRLKKNPVPWNEDHTKIVKIVKSRVKSLPCLTLADHKAFKIVETDASDIGFGGILKQRSNNQELLVRFTSGTKTSLYHLKS